MAKIGRRWHGHGGRQISSRARWVMVPRLRARRFFALFRRCLQALKKWSRLKEEDGGAGRLQKKQQKGYCYSPTNVGGEIREFKLRPWYRSNSFYTEAIADCLEFIKRNSIDSNTSTSSDNDSSSTA